MTTNVIIVRLYAGFIALTTTLIFALGLNGILHPRPGMPDDVYVGLFLVIWHLPIAILSWRAALWWRPTT